MLCGGGVVWCDIDALWCCVQSWSACAPCSTPSNGAIRTFRCCRIRYFLWCCGVLWCAVLCCTVLCSTVLCCAVLCCAVLHCVTVCVLLSRPWTGLDCTSFALLGPYALHGGWVGVVCARGCTCVHVCARVCTCVRVCARVCACVHAAGMYRKALDVWDKLGSGEYKQQRGVLLSPRHDSTEDKDDRDSRDHSEPTTSRVEGLAQTVDLLGQLTDVKLIKEYAVWVLLADPVVGMHIFTSHHRPELISADAVLELLKNVEKLAESALPPPTPLLSSSSLEKSAQVPSSKDRPSVSHSPSPHVSLAVHAPNSSPPSAPAVYEYVDHYLEFLIKEAHTTVRSLVRLGLVWVWVLVLLLLVVLVWVLVSVLVLVWVLVLAPHPSLRGCGVV